MNIQEALKNDALYGSINRKMCRIRLADMINAAPVIIASIY